MKVELVCTTSTLLREISSKEATCRDVAQTYALALRSSEETDWTAVNKAILLRWSKSALVRIKNWAWSGRCFEGAKP